MKKTLCLTALILTSVSAYAVECIKPKECTLWAHQMCTASQKFLGDDECLECGCPTGYTEMPDKSCCKNDRLAEHGGVKECCLDSQSYLTASNSETFCCGGAMQAVTTSGDCCIGQVYMVDGNESCEPSDECPEGEEKVDDGTCCNKNKILEGNGKICCSDNEEPAAGICCPKEKLVIKADGIKECCLDDEEKVDDGTCCPIDLVSFYEDSKGNIIKTCCNSPEEEALSPNGECCKLEDEYNLYKMVDRYPFEDYVHGWWEGYYPEPQKDNKACCSNGTLYTYKTIIKKSDGLYKEDMKICCNNSVSSCTSGVLIPLGNETCGCGCLTDWDCNKNYKKGDIIHRCQPNNTCEKEISFDISGIRINIEGFEGGKFTREKAEKLVENIRQDLLATSGNDNVKIVFTGEISDPRMDEDIGYSTNGDGSIIHINSGICKEEAGAFECRATIIHENIHRVDNINQPNWYRARKDITKLYQRCLTEINAQATGSLSQLRGTFEHCYRYKDGQVYPTCGPSLEFNEEACKKCMESYKSLLIGGRYRSKYVTLDNALRYYSDPSWAQDKNCSGLRAELEEAFTQSGYAERAYFSERRREASRILSMVNDEVKEKVSRFKQLSSLDIGLFGMISRTGFLWNSKPSPSMASDIAKLYSQNAQLCMSPERFMNHPNIRLGFEDPLLDINEFEEAYDFVKSNPECGPENVFQTSISQKCEEKLSCLTDQWREGCWPVQEWMTHIGEIETYTID